MKQQKFIALEQDYPGQVRICRLHKIAYDKENVLEHIDRLIADKYYVYILKEVAKNGNWAIYHGYGGYFRIDRSFIHNGIAKAKYINNYKAKEHNKIVRKRKRIRWSTKKEIIDIGTTILIWTMRLIGLGDE